MRGNSAFVSITTSVRGTIPKPPIFVSMVIICTGKNILYAVNMYVCVLYIYIYIYVYIYIHMCIKSWHVFFGTHSFELTTSLPSAEGMRAVVPPSCQGGVGGEALSTNKCMILKRKFPCSKLKFRTPKAISIECKWIEIYDYNLIIIPKGW